MWQGGPADWSASSVSSLFLISLHLIVFRSLIKFLGHKLVLAVAPRPRASAWQGLNKAIIDLGKLSVEGAAMDPGGLFVLGEDGPATAAASCCCQDNLTAAT